MRLLLLKISELMCMEDIPAAKIARHKKMPAVGKKVLICKKKSDIFYGCHEWWYDRIEIYYGLL